MKTALAVMFTCVAIAPAILAQESDGSTGLILTAGLNSSRFSEENSENVDCLLCLGFGADLLFGQRGPLSFSSGMHYTPSGGKYSFGEGDGYSIETRSALGYLNIPVEARYEFGAGGLRPFVRGGGVFGLLLAAKSKTTTNFNGEKNETETDIKDQKKSTNLGLSVGGGVSFPLGGLRAVASVRYLLGLTNTVKDNRAPSAKTRDLTYSVGVRFPVF